MLYTFLYTGEQLAANPMQLVGRPKLAKALPKALPRTAVEALLSKPNSSRSFGPTSTAASSASLAPKIVEQ